MGNINILNDEYYEKLTNEIHNIRNNNKNNIQMMISNDENIKVRFHSTKEDYFRVFRCINWDDGSEDITIENYYDLYSYNITLNNNNEFVSIIENKKNSLDDMFYEYYRDINITVPKTIINLLKKDDYNEKMLGYNLLKNII